MVADASRDHARRPPTSRWASRGGEQAGRRPRRLRHRRRRAGAPRRRRLHRGVHRRAARRRGRVGGRGRRRLRADDLAAAQPIPGSPSSIAPTSAPSTRPRSGPPSTWSWWTSRSSRVRLLAAQPGRVRATRHRLRGPGEAPVRGGPGSRRARAASSPIPTAHVRGGRGCRRRSGDVGHRVRSARVPSPITGAKGNREFLLHRRRRGCPVDAAVPVSEAVST